MGKKVILVSQYGHLGGLTSSGLGWTDIGNPAILGGLSREFYHKIYKHYENDVAWKQQKRSEFGDKGQGTKAFNSATKLASVFEPKVAEAIFDQMVKETGVIVIQGRLDLKDGVQKTGKRISKIMLEDGSSVEGKMFIDASYEGDLLPGAGVSFMIGREPNALCGETGNGITGPSKQNQLRKGIDHYMVKGDAKSGLLPGINPNMAGAKGDGDKNLQAYCYRMVLTNAEDNRVAIKKPDGYDEKITNCFSARSRPVRNGVFSKPLPCLTKKRIPTTPAAYLPISLERIMARAGTGLRLITRSARHSPRDTATGNSDWSGLYSIIRVLQKKSARCTHLGGYQRTSSLTTATGPTTFTSARLGG